MQKQLQKHIILNKLRLQSQLKMKSSLKTKSYFNSTPIHSFPHSTDDKQKNCLSLSDSNKNSFGQVSQSEDCLQTYFNILPEHKRKHNVSIFNFFIKKSPKKHKQTQNNQQTKSLKSSFQQGSFITKKLFEPYPSLSTQKLKIVHIDSAKKFEICNEKVFKDPQQVLRDRQNADQIINKINENLSKNVKFDRKKYMYYRYRKRPFQQKGQISLNDIPEHVNKQKQKVKRSFANLNTKPHEPQIEKNNENDSVDKNLVFRRSFFGVIPAKNKTLAEVKCKLTIEPMRRQSSYRLIDRQSFSKTSRQTREKKQMQKSATKIFSQAIHFKSRKGKRPNASTSQQNPETPSSLQREQKILGWNFAEQQQHQQQYF